MAIIFGFQLLVPQPERVPVSEDQTLEQSSVDLNIQNTNSQIIINRDEVISSSGRVSFDNGKCKLITSASLNAFLHLALSFS